MNRFFFNADNRLRNGWWILIYIALIAGFGLVRSGLMWICKKAGMPGGLWVKAVSLAFLLGATWAVAKLRKESLSTVGFDLDRRWAREFALGVAIGMAQLGAAALMVTGLGGVTWALDPARSLQAVASGWLFFLFVSINEETLFRGFLFQRLRDGLGLWPTQALLAALFAFAHWGNPGMHGATKVWATLDIALGAVVLGMAYVRTGSLALPIGIHLGWNWMQGHILGFGVSGLETHGWLRPVFQGKPEWLTGGAFGLEASVFAVVVDLALLCVLLFWKGTSSSPAAAPSFKVPDPISA